MGCKETTTLVALWLALSTWSSTTLKDYVPLGNRSVDSLASLTPFSWQRAYSA